MTTATEALGASQAASGEEQSQQSASGLEQSQQTSQAATADTDKQADSQAQPVDWLGDAAPDLHEFARANGYKGPADVLTNVRELQRYMGADKAGRGVVIPKDADDTEGWGQLYAKLGRPETPEGYGLDKLEGADPAFAGEAAKTFHELGISERQAAQLAGWWGKALTERSTADDTAYLERAEREMAELNGEWGQAADANSEMARRGAQAFGFSAEELDKIERSIGTKALMQRFLEVGKKLGEDVLPAGRQAQSGLTSAGAMEQIAAKLQDQEFMKKVRAGDGAAKREMDRLYQAAYPE